jgi:hypothetical protein
MKAFGAILFLLNLGLLAHALTVQQEVLPVHSQDSFCPGKLSAIYYKIYKIYIQNEAGRKRDVGSVTRPVQTQLLKKKKKIYIYIYILLQINNIQILKDYVERTRDQVDQDHGGHIGTNYGPWRGLGRSGLGKEGSGTNERDSNPNYTGVAQKQPRNLQWLNTQKVNTVRQLIFKLSLPQDLKI